ncbi:hypothetical protein BXZ70DRAFT_890675, partial [Cristinia sonorae]
VVFAGQSYVALSRAASLEGLQVVRFDPTKVQAHAEVVKWSKKMEETEVTLSQLAGPASLSLLS